MAAASYRNKTVFLDGVVGVVENFKGHRAKNGRCLEEGDLVLLIIGSGFSIVPFKFDIHFM